MIESSRVEGFAEIGNWLWTDLCVHVRRMEMWPADGFGTHWNIGRPGRQPPHAGEAQLGAESRLRLRFSDSVNG